MKMDTFVDALAWIDYLIDEVREFDGPVLDAVTADPVSPASMSLCVNMQRASSAKYVCLLQLVQHFKPVIVWLMEAYVDLLAPSRYVSYRLNDVYHSVLWLHRRYSVGRYVTRLDYDVLVDKYLFAYFAPRMRRAEVRSAVQPHQEIIDLNVLTHQLAWNLFCEIRHIHRLPQ